MHLTSHCGSIYWQSRLVISDVRRVATSATQMMWVRNIIIYIGQWAAQCTSSLNSIAQQFLDFTYWKEAKHWVVSLHAKTSKLSVSHSPPTLISYNSLCRKYQYKLLYYFHITVEQGTVNFVHCQSSNCTLTAIQLGDAILTLGMHKCTQYSFILSRWATHQMWKWLKHARTCCILMPCLYFQPPILVHCILTTSWMRNRKILLLVSWCRCCTLWEFYLWSLTF